jgi:hypothetical protein
MPILYSLCPAQDVGHVQPTRVWESRREGMDVFIIRGAGCKPEWTITPKINYIASTPSPSIPLPQWARKVGEKESFSSFIVTLASGMDDCFRRHPEIPRGRPCYCIACGEGKWYARNNEKNALSSRIPAYRHQGDIPGKRVTESYIPTYQKSAYFASL